jgi:hypothetical protein
MKIELSFVILSLHSGVKVILLFVLCGGRILESSVKSHILTHTLWANKQTIELIS